ncbi:MAG: polysaccharide deacetylase family protein [Alphaproteobacteria bacterium]
MQDGMEPWQWSEEVWRGIVGQVSAGRSLKPAQWKDGARCAVAMSFDCDHETTDLSEGGHSIGRLSQGEFGSRKGILRIHALLERYAVPATFFVPAVTALLHPEEQRCAVANGHEVGLHGWIHELNTKVPPADERDLYLRAADVLERVTGIRPAGMRTPSWDFSSETLSIEKELGLVYDSSLMADDDPYELLQAGRPSGIVELPVEWIRDDAVYLNMNRSPAIRPQMPLAAVLDIFKREFDGAYAEGGVFQLTMHPHIIGHRSRITTLDELLDYIRQHQGVWFATHAEIASFASSHASQANLGSEFS